MIGLAASTPVATPTFEPQSPPLLPSNWRSAPAPSRLQRNLSNPHSSPGPKRLRLFLSRLWSSRHQDQNHKGLTWPLLGSTPQPNLNSPRPTIPKPRGRPRTRTNTLIFSHPTIHLPMPPTRTGQMTRRPILMKMRPIQPTIHRWSSTAGWMSRLSTCDSICRLAVHSEPRSSRGLAGPHLTPLLSRWYVSGSGNPRGFEVEQSHPLRSFA